MKKQKKFSFLISERRFLWVYLLTIIPIWEFISILRENKPLYNSMSGLPWSDAAGWRSCQASIAEFGTLPLGGVDEFCLRRPIFPFFLGMAKFVLRNDTLVLTLLLACFIVALGVFLKNSIEHKLVPFGILVSYLAISNWNLYGSGQFMTEAMGIVIAVVILSTCLSYLHDFNRQNFTVLLFYVTLLDLVRPSDPLLKYLLVGFYLITTLGLREKLYGFLTSFAIIFVFPVLLKVAGSVIGYDKFLTKGNSWSVVYGLVNGNRNYFFADSIRTDFPQASEYEFWQIVKEKTIRIIIDDPTVLIKAIFQNIRQIIGNLDLILFPTSSSSLTKYFLTLIFGVVFAALVIECLIRINSNSLSKLEKSHYIKQQVFSLLILCSALLGYSITYLNDPNRTNSASLIYAFGGFLFAVFNARRRSPAIMNTGLARTKDQRYLFNPGLVVFFLFASILIAPIGKSSPVPSNLKCKNADSIKLTEKTILVKAVPDITLDPKFPWYGDLANLGTGFLIQGHYSLNGEILHGSFYLNSANLTEVSKCLRIKSLNPSSSSANLGFLEVEISS